MNPPRTPPAERGSERFASRHHRAAWRAELRGPRTEARDGLEGKTQLGRQLFTLATLLKRV